MKKAPNKGTYNYLKKQLPELNNFNLLFVKIYNMVVNPSDKSINWSDLFLLYKIYKCYNFISIEDYFDYILLLRNELNKDDDEVEEKNNKNDINSLLKKNNKYY